MKNPDKRDAAVRRVVSAARLIVTYQIGLPVGCQRLSRALYWLSPYEQNLPTVIDDYMKAVLTLPIGAERLEWDRAALKEKDVALETINQKFRDRIFNTCWSLLDRFNPTGDSR